jgi:hypothetical protein
MPVPYSFQLSTLPIPLANLDANFTYFTTAISVSGTAVTVAGTTTTAAAVVNANSATNALRITQVGTGNALLVEDSANPDATPFVVNGNGEVTVGHTSPTAYISGIAPNFQVLGTDNKSSSTALMRYSADAFGCSVLINKSRGAIGAQGIVSSGDSIGTIYFAASDGANPIAAASISSSIDGTPGTNDMPGRLMFSTTADGASSSTERMRINSAGNIFFGGNTANLNFSLTLGKSITGAVSASGLFVSSQIQTDVTNTATYFSTSVAQIAGVTTTNVRHYGTAQGIISGTITNQVGFYADAGLISAANNYGVFSNLPLGTSRTITFVQRTTNVVTITTSVAHGYTAGQSVTVAATTNTSLNGTFVIASVPTTTTFTYAQTAADIVLVADTGSTVVIGRFNIYSAGTAPNYFLGNVGIGTTTPNAPLEISGTSASMAVRATSATQASYVLAAASDYFSAPSYRTTQLVQYNASATGTSLGLSNAGLGALNFVNGTNAAIFTNGANILKIGTNSATAIQIASNQVLSLGSSAGSESLRVTPVASAVNYLSAFGSVTGQTPTISAQGSDTNIPLGLSSKGTSGLTFYTNAFGNIQLNIAHTASAVNYLQITGGIVTTGFPIVSAVGTDTNIDLAINPKGTGNVRFGTLTANADAPITGYITIKDSAGTVRKLAVIA